jgi:spore germination cell wall hydrolase CwlJ-like protein
MAFDKAIATMTVYCEASSEDHTARLGVAWCLVNRLRSARFGDTISEVCLKRLQFSSWDQDQRDNFNLRRAARCPDTDPVMLDCGQAFDEALSGSVPDPTHGATHYFDASIINNPPAWSVGAIQTVRLGRLLFWRGVK